MVYIARFSFIRMLFYVFCIVWGDILRPREEFLTLIEIGVLKLKSYITVII